MPTSLRFLTYPELLANMFAHAAAPASSGGIGPAADLNRGSQLRTILECAALSDADQHVQMSRIPNLFSLDKCRGDDLDQRAAEIGSEILVDLRRLQANTSTASIVVGNGTFLQKTTIAIDATHDSATFVVVNGTAFPTSGAVTLNAGSANAEELIYTRSGNTFTVVLSGTLTVLQRSHASGEPVTSVSIRSTLASGVIVGATTATLLAGTGAAWTATGTIIFDRSTTTQEKIAFTRSGDTLTLATSATFAHSAGSTVIQGTDGTDHVIPVGAQPNVPPSRSTPQINFSVQQPGGTLFDGDFVSGLIPVQSVLVGASTRVGGNQITGWTTPPFAGATVTNPSSATRGADREDDDTYRQRIKDTVQSFSGGGTPLSIVTKVKGLEDPETGAQVAFVQMVEPVLPGQSLLYITDGTSGFSLRQQPFLGRDVIISDASVGDARGKLGTYGPPYSYSTTSPVSPRLFSSAGTARGVSTSVGTNFLEDTTQSFTVNAFAGMFLKTIDNVFRQIASNTAIRFVLSSGDSPTSGAFSVYNLLGSPLVPGTDFSFNPSTGDIELVTSLSLHDGLVAASDGASPSLGAYLYSSGLAAHVQRTVNGDPADYSTFPGLRVGGNWVLVAVPTTISQAFVLSVVPARGFTLAQLVSPVQIAVQTMINASGMGAKIEISDLIVAVKLVPGVDDVIPVTPSANISVPSGTLMRIAATDVSPV
jgi:uncharacterized phage protein gp47/JayE